jgi:hypothetical protein
VVVALGEEVLIRHLRVTGLSLAVGHELGVIGHLSHAKQERAWSVREGHSDARVTALTSHPAMRPSRGPRTLFSQDGADVQKVMHTEASVER